MTVQEFFHDLEKKMNDTYWKKFFKVSKLPLKIKAKNKKTTIFPKINESRID